MIAVVAIAMGKDPGWIMEHLTIAQLGLLFRKMGEYDLKFAETQSAIIWSMASGKYKKMNQANRISAEELVKLGAIKEASHGG